MAYTLKSITYLGTPRKILLQNENGPCPLIAATNALLLRGVLTLPASCVRNGVASTDDIVNILAERVLKGSPVIKEVVGEEETSLSEYHLDELLSLFPSLQYGMDVNPKFTEGPNGYEYTKNLTAFDLLGVELVHGWLLDPNNSHGDEEDENIVKLIGNKSYNQLAEIIVMGNVANAEIEKKLASSAANKDDGWVDVPKHTSDKVNENTTDSQDQEGNKPMDEAESTDNSPQDLPSEAEQKQQQEQHEEKARMAMEGSLVNKFLTDTGHQLTQFGLHELHKHIQEDSTYVFFRNNHFATLTKSNNNLFLLVTDLGYANVKEVIWEKIDDQSITGDTEYADEFFEQTKPRQDIAAASGPSLTPEQQLAQRGRAEADYQLAIELSKNENALDENEGDLIAAATEASMQEWNKTNNKETHAQDLGNDSSTKVNEQRHNIEDSDMDIEMAKKLQAEYENDAASQRLAQELQAEERQRVAVSNTSYPAQRERSTTRPDNCCTQNSSSGCVIS